MFLEISQNSRENTCARVSTCNFIKKETLARVFSFEFCEISKSTFISPLGDCFWKGCWNALKYSTGKTFANYLKSEAANALYSNLKKLESSEEKDVMPFITWMVCCWNSLIWLQGERISLLIDVLITVRWVNIIDQSD